MGADRDNSYSRELRVIVVEEGDYEQRHVVLVAASREAAKAAVLRLYGPPYRVTWIDNTDGLLGKFEAVQGFSTRHEAQFDFTEYELEDSSP